MNELIFTADQLLRLPAVLAVLSVSRSTFYTMMEQGRAPQPVRVGARAVAWRKSDIEKIIRGEWLPTLPRQVA